MRWERHVGAGPRLALVTFLQRLEPLVGDWDVGSQCEPLRPWASASLILIRFLRPSKGGSESESGIDSRESPESIRNHGIAITNLLQWQRETDDRARIFVIIVFDLDELD